jgi:hypothetical protein
MWVELELAQHPRHTRNDSLLDGNRVPSPSNSRYGHLRRLLLLQYTQGVLVPGTLR